jgi:tetratricopeptide (TPR) repeat protein
VLATGMQELESRALAGEATVRMRRGEVREAIALLERARALSEGASFSDVERADVIFRLGVARYKLNSMQTAIGLFDEALKLAERSEIPSDQLRSSIFAWRSRCYRRRRDLEAAREDVERALELAEGLSDKRTAADVYFQASIIADREGHWVLARSYAERAKTSNAHSSWPKASATSARPPTSTSRRRSSPTAKGTGSSRAHMPSARRPRTRSFRIEPISVAC